MIEQEILEVLADPADDGSRLNEIIDEFRGGRDVNELQPILDSSNTDLVSIGAYILGELDPALYSADSFLDRLHALTDHTDPSIRLHAFGALFPTLDPNQATTRRLFERLLCDPDDGVRWAATDGAARLSLHVR